jgi:crossover junction endodeoxyribonuclease RusA
VITYKKHGQEIYSQRGIDMSYLKLSTADLEQLKAEIEAELYERDQQSSVFEFPYGPTVNHYWNERCVNTGKGYSRVMKSLGAKGKQFREDVKRIVGDVEPFTTKEVSVKIDAHVPDRRRRDIDNIIKPTLDAMEHAGVYKDDCQINFLIVRKHPPLKGGKMTVTVREEK